ncbi:13901_t:CDS:2 [Entrophospora sp. SA101]|nr:13901_t:CDS:2 [Entrophospora sp. SA101]
MESFCEVRNEPKSIVIQKCLIEITQVEKEVKYKVLDFLKSYKNISELEFAFLETMAFHFFDTATKEELNKQIENTIIHIYQNPRDIHQNFPGGNNYTHPSPGGNNYTHPSPGDNNYIHQNPGDNNFGHQNPGNNNYIHQNFIYNYISQSNNFIHQNPEDNNYNNQNSSIDYLVFQNPVYNNNFICQNPSNNSFVMKDDNSLSSIHGPNSFMMEEAEINKDEINIGDHNQMSNIDSEKRFWELKKEYDQVSSATSGNMKFTTVFKDYVIRIYDRIHKEKSHFTIFGST